MVGEDVGSLEIQDGFMREGDRKERRLECIDICRVEGGGSVSRFSHATCTSRECPDGEY